VTVETRYASRAMPGWIGPWEIAILLVIVLLVFGPKRLPEMGRSLGRGMREFKNSITGKDEDEEAPAELPAATETETEPEPKTKESVSAASERDA
jgi:sec-independent protein translocase protein TatA